MKLYNLVVFEGHKQVVGYRCNNCGDIESGEDIPKTWITEHEKHYCNKCLVECNRCLKLFSVHYAEEWFDGDLCENCPRYVNIKL